MIDVDYAQGGKTEMAKALQELHFLRAENARLRAERDALAESRGHLATQLDTVLKDSERSSRQFRQALEIEAARVQDVDHQVAGVIHAVTGLSPEELLDSYENRSIENLNLRADNQSLKAEISQLNVTKKGLTVSRGMIARELRKSSTKVAELESELKTLQKKLVDSRRMVSKAQADLEVLRRSFGMRVLSKMERTARTAVRDTRSRITLKSRSRKSIGASGK